MTRTSTNQPEERDAGAAAPDQKAAPTISELDDLQKSRVEKLKRWREDLGVEPYGGRVDGLISLAEARSRFDDQAHAEWDAAQSENRTIDDPRPQVLVAGRCIQHRAMGKLVFIVLRDHTGDLQVSISKAALDATAFKIASKLDYGDIVVAGGRMGRTKKGEICVWATRFEVHCKNISPPPEKWHGLTDPELRYRQRYVDMFANPDTMRTFLTRSELVTRTRRFMDQRGFVEVETPMMQPIAGGAAARPFVTHHNALGMTLFLRIAPELYLKRLLVGGMPRVYEINRNFRNEGVSRRHNPEFTMMEVYEAFGDYGTMAELTESLAHELATEAHGREPGDSASESGPVLPFGDLNIDYSRPFPRRTYAEIFETALGFSMFDEAEVQKRAADDHIEDAAQLDHWLLVSELFERHCEKSIDPARPTFVMDFPSAISPLTRPHEANPALSYRWELFIAGMEIANAYTELNDPETQLARFTEQLAGEHEEDRTFRALDEDFIQALRVGMPPAGGLGVGIDRVIMLMTNSTTIRDVILFPLMKPQSPDQMAEPAADEDVSQNP